MIAKILKDLPRAGYTFEGEGVCERCGQRVGYWVRPRRRLATAMDPMAEPGSPVVSHLAVCKGAVPKRERERERERP